MKRYYTQKKRKDIVNMHLNGESIMSIHQATELREAPFTIGLTIAILMLKTASH